MSDVTVCQTTCMSGRSMVFFPRTSYFQLFMFFLTQYVVPTKKRSPNQSKEPISTGKEVQKGAHSGWVEAGSPQLFGSKLVSRPITWEFRCKARPRGNVTSCWQHGSGRSTKGHNVVFLGGRARHAAPRLSKMISDISLFSHC